MAMKLIRGVAFLPSASCSGTAHWADGFSGSCPRSVSRENTCAGPQTLKLASNERGQGVTEYIILLGVVVGAFVLVQKGLQAMNFAGMLTAPITHNFAMAYKYGHPQAQGYDEGQPAKHPRVYPNVNPGGNNFRIFIRGPGGDGGSQ